MAIESCEKLSLMSHIPPSLAHFRNNSLAPSIAGAHCQPPKRSTVAPKERYSPRVESTTS
eukprot:2550202-Lingulodinium_polyedra.AAC.1